ncbi:CIR protein PIR protein [Plasmodium vinckei lentum]|uniref:CIR protein PIR protein n=1 Tax=Plasmodium vinckei lentum TaxID=138297 RepID=A0A6V7RZ60_PLAVN|nr:CIR protein PIR protein [Plasmodium vinckei lentum]
MDDQICESFLGADNLYNEGNVDMDEINKHSEFYVYCPSRKCRNSMHGFVALSTYLFLQLKAHANNKNGEYFLMWLSDKLFKIHIQKTKKKKNPITLDEAYNNYLKKHIDTFEYWNLLGNIKGLKNANLRHMNEFYKLLNHICKTIIYLKYDYNKSTNHIQNSTNSFNQYMLLYQNVSKCNSYLHLLDNLKKTYEDFRTIIKKGDSKIASSLQTLTTIENIDSYFVENFNEFDFSDSKCKLRYDDRILEKWEKVQAQRRQKNNESQGGDITLSTQLPSSSAGTVASPNMTDNGEDTPGGIDIAVGDTQNKANTKGSGQKNSGGDAGDQKSHQSDPINPNDNTQTSGANQGDRSVDSGSGIESTSSGSRGPDNGSVGGSDGNQVSQDGSGGSGSGARGHQEDSVDGPGSGQVTTGNGTEGTDGGQGGKGGPIDGSNGDQGSHGDSGESGGSGSSKDGAGDTDNESLNGGDGQDNQRGPDSAPGTSGSQSASWLSFDIGSSIFGIASKGMEQLNNALEFFEQKKEQLTKVTDTIKDLYSTSVSNIKTAYDNSRNFLNNIIDHISSQPEKVDIFDNPGGNKLGSGGTGGGIPTPNGSPTPQKDSPQSPPGTPHTSLPSQNPKEQTNAAQLSQGPPGSQNSDQNNQGGSKIPVISPVDKPENYGAEVKGNETTGIGDMNLLKEYKQIGISIIVILIPITLAIMHKYLSSGWRKELKKKKNMKKVINSIGGKRPVQIIINASSQKKKIKKSINFVYGKKSPLLNIYKLMQADPVPFINLFFLLIFFVYKRNHNSLEL